MSIENLIDKAFYYRGDVTFHLKDGRQVEGYIFNRDAQKKIIQLFLKDEVSPCKLSYADILDIHFTGEDTAAGKAWEDWKTKHGKK